MSKDKAPNEPVDIVNKFLNRENIGAGDFRQALTQVLNQVHILEAHNNHLEAKLANAISLASHKFDCTVMTNGKHECNCGYNELKRWMNEQNA